MPQSRSTREWTKYEDPHTNYPYWYPFAATAGNATAVDGYEHDADERFRFKLWWE